MTCRVTDIAPRTKGHMHATDSLDFLIVHEGQVTLHLDSGEKKVIKQGEVIGTYQRNSTAVSSLDLVMRLAKGSVQRGTHHAWENETDEWVRMYVVLLQAEKSSHDKQ
jgi:quercetin dioxygenase-like cupin family protein